MDKFKRDSSPFQNGFLFSGYSRDLSAGVKLLEHEADHSSLSSPEVKNVWRYTCTTPCMPSCHVEGQMCFALLYFI